MKKYCKYIDTYLSLIDSGKLFWRVFFWIFAIIAILSLAGPVLLLIIELGDGMLSSPYLLSSILTWLFVALAGLVSFRVWWNRKNQIRDIAKKSSEFIMIPLFAHFLQTFGEALGVIIAIIGFGNGLISTLFRGIPLFPGFDLPSIALVVIMPVIGFFVVVLSRAMAESCKALVTVAINTKR